MPEMDGTAVGGFISVLMLVYWLVVVVVVLFYNCPKRIPGMVERMMELDFKVWMVS